MKRKWVNMILGRFYNLALWPHPWPSPWSFKVIIWNSFIWGTGWPIDNERKGCESSIHDPNIDFYDHGGVGGCTRYWPGWLQTSACRQHIYLILITWRFSTRLSLEIWKPIWGQKWYSLHTSFLHWSRAQHIPLLNGPGQVKLYLTRGF